jgi:hypothetical protein
MKLDRYLAESERRGEFLATGDRFDVVINEELALEFDVMYHNKDMALVEADAVALELLESCGCTFEQELDEAEYQGREVKLGKPMRGDVKKYKVFVKDPKTGNVKKVNFGDPNMQIRRDNPEARKNFRARHGCGTPRASDRTKAAYWSCRLWSTKPVSKILKGK